MIEHVLPRHLQIIYEINRRFLSTISINSSSDFKRLSRLSVIEETAPKQVRMANLAIAGNHCVNGVAALHTDLLKTTVMADFYQIWPEKFRQKFLAIKRKNKERLANIILQTARVKVNPESLFDIQTKRIHEYKRQLLNVLHII